MYRTRRRRAARALVKIQRKYKKKRTKQSTINKKVYKLINAQQTYLDYFLNISPSTAGVINELGLLNITRGTNVSQRLGEKIELKSINIRTFCFILNTVALNADAYNNLRIIIFSLPQPVTAGIGVQVTDILQNLDVLSHYKKDSKLKFKIHHDILYYLDNQGFSVGAASNPVWQAVAPHQKRYFKKLNFPTGLPVTYDSNGDVIKNNVLMLAISDSGVTPHPIIQGRIRLIFQP